MNKSSLRTLTGLLLIVVPILITTAFTLLQMNFEYPTILRQPTDYILQKFVAGGSGLIATWYLFMFSAVLFVPIAVLVRRLFDEQAAPFIGVATAIGVLSGLVQAFGLIRWVFVVPYLAETYTAPTATAATQESVAVVFQSFHRYAGVALGEHLGYLFTGVWVILISIAMLRSPLFKSWLGWSGMVLGLGILMGMLEPAGMEWAGTVNALSYMVWSVWLIIVGVFVLLAARKSREPVSAPVLSRAA